MDDEAVAGIVSVAIYALAEVLKGKVPRFWALDNRILAVVIAGVSAGVNAAIAAMSSGNVVESAAIGAVAPAGIWATLRTFYRGASRQSGTPAGPP